MEDSKISLHKEDILSKPLCINIFDEEFLKEKDIALQPLNPLNLVDLDDEYNSTKESSENNNNKCCPHKNVRKFKKCKKHRKISKSVKNCSNVIFIHSKNDCNNIKEKDDDEDLLSKLVAKAFCIKNL